MNNTDNVSFKSIEIEVGIKLLEYLKRSSCVSNDMYWFVLDKLLKTKKRSGD